MPADAAGSLTRFYQAVSLDAQLGGHLAGRILVESTILGRTGMAVTVMGIGKTRTAEELAT